MRLKMSDFVLRPADGTDITASSDWLLSVSMCSTIALRTGPNFKTMEVPTSCMRAITFFVTSLDFRSSSSRSSAFLDSSSIRNFRKVSAVLSLVERRAFFKSCSF